VGALGFGKAVAACYVEVTYVMEWLVRVRLGLLWQVNLNYKIMEKNYQWRIKSFAKNVDPDEAIREIQKVEAIYGKITADTILKAAQDKDCVLHDLFEWDNTKAAQHYRLQQARTLINNIEVKIISDGETRSVSVYEVVQSESGQQYKHIETLTFDEIEQVKRATLKALSVLKFKLSVYKQFDKVVNFVDAAIGELVE
jgi:integrase